MKRRVYIKFLFVLTKGIFWITFAYGLFLLSTISSSEEGQRLADDTEEEIKRSGIKIYYDTAGSSDNATGSANSTCNRISFPISVAAKERWQPIDKSRSMYCFSAYYVKDRSTVFIIGVRPRNQVNVDCQFWKRTHEGLAELMYETEADARALLDDLGYRYAPTIFECYVNMDTTVHFVSLTTRHCETQTNILEIQNATRGVLYKRKLTVCLPPLVFQYDKTADFVRWIEINRLLGVDHFVVYNFSSGPNIDQVLKYYSKRGLAEVVQWRPPMADDNFPSEIKPVELGNFGQTVALNDCMYRSKSKSHFITDIGFNEFILPLSKNETIYEMVTNLKRNFAVYHVTRTVSQQTNFSSEKDKPKAVKGNSSPGTVKLKQRQRNVRTELSSGDEMSKLIIRTAEVDFVSLHNVPGVDTYPIPSRKAVFHKNTGFGGNHLLDRDREEVIPFPVIMNANRSVQNVWKSLQNVVIK
ncbi:uncharacterized protein LOC132719478 [Ruditapes philippinarum]|uniref:uncharacterized protein LOC132719478 n=1 Tax=Ruditapes philippinarum TaxID=129788 RepID=UPI00295A5CD1|nr:uncharacterized protein LOC132719478 [Ruditapes philippinarum]